MKGEQAEHTWDKGTVVLAATENQEGMMRYKCTVCSKQKTESIDKLPHKHVFKNVKKDEFLKAEADCVNAAVYYQSCACGEAGTGTFEFGNPLGHDFGNWIYEIAATCTKTGTVGHYHCARCQLNFDANYAELEEISIAIKSHSYTTENPASQYLKSAADCKQPAVYFYSCVCGSMGDKTFEYGEVAEHAFGNGVVTLPATETSTGVRTFTCAVCSITKTEVINAILPQNQPIYELDAFNCYYTVAGFNGAAEEVVIPATYNGLRVAAIGEEAFANNSTIKKVVLPNSIVAIGARAFQNCSSLVEVNVPETVSTIGQEAFYLCTKLEKVQFSEKESISADLFVGSKAFSCCISLKEVVLASNVRNLPDYAFENCYALEKITLNAGLSSIGNFAFDGCSALTEIVLPESVSAVGVGAFRNATALTDVTLSPLMTEIAISTFHNCKSLKKIDLLQNITTIGASAFSNCESLETINVLGSIGSWGSNAFYQCVKLSEINLAATISTPLVFANNYVFYNAGTAGDGITLKLTTDTIIPANLFNPVGEENLPKITKLVFEVVDGGSSSILSTYASLPHVETVVLDSKIMRIVKGAFDGCPNLKYAEHSKGKYLGNEDNPYYALISVTDKEIDGITIAATCAVIADSAFENCKTLSAVIVPKNVKAIGYAAFNGCKNLASITVPFVGAQLQDSPNTNFGYIFGAGHNTSNPLFVPSALKTVAVTDAITIGKGAFGGCNNLENLTIPFVGAGDGITAEDDYQYPFGYIFGTTSFDGSQATTQRYYGDSGTYLTNETYYLPTSLKTVRVTGGNILYGAFYNCAIKDIVIESSVTEIGEGAFYNSGVVNVTLPSSLKDIGNYAFESCDEIKNISLPSGLETIGSYAFSGCSKLGIVFYTGSSLQWANVSVGTDSVFAAAKKVFNYDGSEITVSFVTNCEANVASVTVSYLSTLPTISKDGYVLEGWYDNAEFSGSKVSVPYYNKEKTTLYAKWAINDGSSFERAIVAQSGSTYSVQISTGGQKVYFAFTPTTSGSYTIQSTGSSDTYGRLYNASQTQLTSNNDGGTNYNFKITYTLTAGTTYYVAVCYNYSSATGTFDVSFSRNA